MVAGPAEPFVLWFGSMNGPMLPWGWPESSDGVRPLRLTSTDFRAAWLLLALVLFELGDVWGARQR